MSAPGGPKLLTMPGTRLAHTAGTSMYLQSEVTRYSGIQRDLAAGIGPSRQKKGIGP